MNAFRVAQGIAFSGGPKAGIRVMYTGPASSIPTGAVGTVTGPGCSYGTQVLFDGHELFAEYGPDGFRPYMNVQELELFYGPMVEVES